MSEQTTREQAVTFFKQANAELVSEYGDMVEGRLFDLVSNHIDIMNAQGDYLIIKVIIGTCFRMIEDQIEEQAEEYALKSSPYYLNEDRIHHRELYR